MAPKRKNDQPTEDLTSREKKKQKVTAARTIAVQPSQPATPSSRNVSQPVAGPSKTVRIDGAKGLPATLDVERFAEARSFEINAMHEAMKNASSSSTHRAWQELPRHLRRRAASHDVRRVPTRLRGKARAEMDPMRKKILGRKLPKRGKERRLKRSDVFLNRQVDKKWLESHIWHAKRMKMENMWGYRLAVQPTEKSFRPSHRAAVHGSILHDASYWSLIQIAGPEHVLKALLESCCDPQGQGPGAKRFIGGVRACGTALYRPQSYPFGFIGPVTVIWRTLPVPLPPANANTVPQQKSGKSKRRRSNKGKEKAAEPVTAEPATAEIARTVWIRCHPSMFKDAFVALKAATSLTLEAFKKSTEYVDKKYDVEIANLNDSVNVFEIMGPKSSQVIKGALSPVDPASRSEFKKFWNSLTDLQSPGSVPTNMIVGAKVWDPRLNFPPKNAKPHVKEDELPSISAAWTCLPSPALAQCDLWDDKTRERLKMPKYKKKELDARRAQSLIPGTPLKPTSNDNHVPIMLIQRSLSSAAPLDPSAPNTNPATNAPSLHGWTLIVPRGWSMPFLTSLVYTGTRVGGQRERTHQAFEAGVPSFPRDFPLAAAYDAFAETRAQDDAARWARKPPAKRPNWDKLSTPSPWRPDWRAVLGLPAPAAEAAAADIVPTQREEPAAKQREVAPWLLRGPDVRAIVDKASKLLNPAAALLDEVNRLRFKRGMDPLGADVKGDVLLEGALVQVRVCLVGRGAPDDLAVVYGVGDDEALQWKKAAAQRKKAGNGMVMDNPPDETELSSIVPPPEKIIGYVTSGNFSLSLGQGHAIAALPLAKYFELQQQDERLSLGGPMIKVRDRHETICRAARISLV